MAKRYTSFFLPNSPIPDPPQFEWLTKFFVVIASLAVVCIILFVVVEFAFDAGGRPLEFGEQPVWLESQPPVKPLDPEKEIENILQQSVLLSPKTKVRIKGKRITYLSTWNSRLGKQIKEPPFPLKLFVNEDYVPWTMQFGNNTWLATIELEPGIQHLRTLVHEVEVFVDDGSDRNIRESERKRIKDWPVFSLHEGVDETEKCAECHILEESPLASNRKGFGPKIGDWKGSESCLFCHAELDFKKIHDHDTKVFSDCRQCHVVHGTASKEKALLRVSPKILCVQCHEQGK